MYAEGFLSGDIVPINEYEQASELDSRKPFKRSFYVYSSDGASRVRFHHDKELLKSGKVEWRELRDIMSYNFTGSSRQLLYVQFANSDLSRQSEITFYSFYLDALSLSDGFYVNDGSGRIFTRHVELTIDVPPTAESMRISQSAAGITAAPWERASTKSPFVLRSNLDLTTGTINANGIYDIYLQFADVNETFLIPINTLPSWSYFLSSGGFDFAAYDVFEINNGLFVSNNFTVALDLILHRMQ